MWVICRSTQKFWGYDPYDFVGNTPMGKTTFWSFTGLAWENFPTTALSNTETAPEPLPRDSTTSGTELLMTKTVEREGR